MEIRRVCVNGSGHSLQVTLPSNYCDVLGIIKGSHLKFTVEDKRIIIELVK